MTPRRLAAVPEPDRNRAVAYIRVSAVMGRQAEDFHSPELQYRAVTDMLGRRGLREVLRIEDIDRTGRDFNREGIQRIFDLARTRQIDVVAIADLSRLGRNTAESLRAIKDLRELGVSVLSAAEQIDDTPEGQFQLGVLLGVAQLYSDQQGRKWRQVHEFMATDGRQVGQPPIGYVQEETGRVTAKGRVVRSGDARVDPILGPAVGQAFRDYAVGVRVREIAERLGALRGQPMWPAQVRQMMRNRFYLGFVTYKGEEFQGQNEPLVDALTWKQVQRRVQADAKTPSRRLQAASAVTGLAICDVCEHAATLRSSKEGKAGRVARIGCGRQSDLRTCSGCGSMSIADVEQAVFDWCKAYLRDLRVNSDAQAARRNRAAVAKASAAHLRAELRRNRSEQADLAVQRVRAKDHLDERAWNDAAGALREAEAALVTALAGSEAAEGLPPRKAAAAVAELVELWPDATSGERNRMLRAVVARVRLKPAAYYRQPASERVFPEPL
jgi:site-specific DNA recombinase